MVIITLEKLNKYIDKLKNNQFKKSNISSYYLTKPLSNEQKKYYSLLFKNTFTSIEALSIKKNVHVVIKYSIEFIVSSPVNILVFLGVKDNEKLNTIKTSKNMKRLTPSDCKMCDVILYNPSNDEELCLIVKMPNDVEITNGSIITIFEFYF